MTDKRTLKQIIERQREELGLFRTSDGKLADMIDPRVFADSLKEFGWTELPDNGFNAIILQAHEKGELYQVNIPKGKHLGDFVFTMIYSAKEVARFFGTDVKPVLVDMVIASNKTKQTEKP
jgi:hypothetical protein